MVRVYSKLLPFPHNFFNSFNIVHVLSKSHGSSLIDIFSTLSTFPHPLAVPDPNMCHYTYALYICCDEPKEFDGVDVLDVEYCSNCPVSADVQLFDDNFFHCPYATAECIGDSDWLCPECAEPLGLEDDQDGLNEDREPDDDFSEYSDDDSDDGLLPPSMFDHFCPSRISLVSRGCRGMD